MRRTISFLNILLLLLLPPVVSTVSAEPLRIGSISGEYVSEVKKFKALTDYLSIHLAPFGIDQVEVVVTHSMDEMSRMIHDDKVDLFIDSPYPSLIISNQTKSKMVLRRWKKGVDQYHSVLFTRKESPIENIQGLKGKRIAFEEPFSTASYFLGKSELISNGLLPVEAPKRGSGDNKAQTADSVAYLFSGADSTTVSWVLRNRVEAGTINHHKFETLKEGIRSKLKIIHQSMDVPRHIVSFRANYPELRISQISRVLTAMDQESMGKAALKQFQKTRKFDLISTQTQNNLQQLKKMVQKINTP